MPKPKPKPKPKRKLSPGGEFERVILFEFDPSEMVVSDVAKVLKKWEEEPLPDDDDAIHVVEAAETEEGGVIRLVLIQKYKQGA